MERRAPLSRLSLASFEALDLSGDVDAAAELRADLEGEVVRRASDGDAGIETLVDELNGLGHRLERRETDPGWVSFFEETNDGARHLWIHVERDEAGGAVTGIVLYHETLESMVVRRRAGLGAEQRAREERRDRFHERGLALASRTAEEGPLSDGDRRILSLYLLETGVANGGFATYLANTEGRWLAEAHAALVHIGASTVAGIVGEVLEALPELRDGLTDEAWAALEGARETLDALDERFWAASDDVALLALDHMEPVEGRPSQRPTT